MNSSLPMLKNGNDVIDVESLKKTFFQEINNPDQLSAGDKNRLRDIRKFIIEHEQDLSPELLGKLFLN